MERWFRRAFAGDVDPRVRLRASSPIVLVRVGLISLIVAVAWFSDLERIGAVTALLIVAVISQPLIASLDAPSTVTWRRLFAGDLVFATAIALTAPSAATNYLLMTAGLIGAAATCFTVTGFFVFAAVSLVGAAMVAVNAGLAQPAPSVATVGIVGLGFGGWMLRSRIVAESARQDRERAVDAAGGIFFTSVVGEPLLWCTGDVESLLGWTDRHDGELNVFESAHPDDIDGFWIPDEELEDGTEIERTARFRTRDGGWKWIHEVSHVVEVGGRLEIRGLMLDHTDHLDGLMRAKTEASTDSLTGLANRRVLLNVLDRESAPGRWVVLLDLDSFKRVNDTLGHDAGDVLLRVVAQRVAARLRASDLLVRVGGDEFAIVLAGGLDEEAALRSVDRVIAAVCEPMDVNGVTLDASISAGLVLDESGSTGARALLRRADLAMYEAKSRPERRACFEPEMEIRHGRKSQLVQDLPGALAAGELRLFFQPVVTADARRVVAAEGLARWDHPSYGLLFPADFLDVVLVSSLAAEFSRAMVVQALEMQRRSAAAGLDLDIAVNLPVSTIEDSGFATWFFERCDEVGADPYRMIVETSERDLHSEARTAAAIRHFAARGVSFSIDDFGTGHSTFERLRWEHVAQLKLDQRIVQGAVRNARDASILRNVVTLAKELGYRVVGEGVETAQQRQLLCGFGVDLLQGHLFAPAMERDDALRFASSPLVTRGVQPEPDWWSLDAESGAGDGDLSGAQVPARPDRRR